MTSFVNTSFVSNNFKGWLGNNKSVSVVSNSVTTNSTTCNDSITKCKYASHSMCFDACVAYAYVLTSFLDVSNPLFPTIWIARGSFRSLLSPKKVIMFRESNDAKNNKLMKPSKNRDSILIRIGVKIMSGSSVWVVVDVWFYKWVYINS